MRMKEFKARRTEIRAALHAKGSKEGSNTLGQILYIRIGLGTGETSEMDSALNGGSGKPKMSSIAAVVKYIGDGLAE